MASVPVKEAVAHRTLATELRQGARGPIPLYLDALAVLYATAADQVSREVKYLAAKLVIAQEARSQGKIKTGKVDEGSHPAEIMTKPLQEKECVFKRGPSWDSRLPCPLSRAPARPQRRVPTGPRTRASAHTARLPGSGALWSGGCSA